MAPSEKKEPSHKIVEDDDQTERHKEPEVSMPEEKTDSTEYKPVPSSETENLHKKDKEISKAQTQPTVAEIQQLLDNFEQAVEPEEKLPIEKGKRKKLVKKEKKKLEVEKQPIVQGKEQNLDAFEPTGPTKEKTGLPVDEQQVPIELQDKPLSVPEEEKKVESQPVVTPKQKKEKPKGGDVVVTDKEMDKLQPPVSVTQEEEKASHESYEENEQKIFDNNEGTVEVTAADNVYVLTGEEIRDVSPSVPDAALDKKDTKEEDYSIEERSTHDQFETNMAQEILEGKQKVPTVEKKDLKVADKMGPDVKKKKEKLIKKSREVTKISKGEDQVLVPETEQIKPAQYKLQAPTDEKELPEEEAPKPDMLNEADINYPKHESHEVIPDEASAKESQASTPEHADNKRMVSKQPVYDEEPLKKEETGDVQEADQYKEIIVEPQEEKIAPHATLPSVQPEETTKTFPKPAETEKKKVKRLLKKKKAKKDDISSAKADLKNEQSIAPADLATSSQHEIEQTEARIPEQQPEILQEKQAIKEIGELQKILQDENETDKVIESNTQITPHSKTTSQGLHIDQQVNFCIGSLNIQGVC